ncbi:hypothetical protein A6B35_30680 (plasmid) [Mesorhizobium amorphae CCNWGS0123]|nr:hypothetical protein A6B35_30680 [Mesorhizobium amorphae CCNWGS0123]
MFVLREPLWQLADNRLKAVFGMAILSADRSEIQPSWGVPWDAQPVLRSDECHVNSWAKYCATGHVGTRIMAMNMQLACHQTVVSSDHKSEESPPGPLDPNPWDVWI